MTKKPLFSAMILGIMSMLLVSCDGKGRGNMDFTTLTTPRLMEEAYSYDLMYLPTKDKVGQSYIGDTMPYYEDGTYYIYYLRDEGMSYNHSIYLLTTKDFVTYSEYPSVIIESGESQAPDNWIGTGSVVKVKDTYYFFYTGHVDSAAFEYKERILVAKGDSPYSFTKVTDWEILPPKDLNQKRDFRDPQAYYDGETDSIRLTVTASKDGIPRVLEYTVSADLGKVEYQGIIFSDNKHGFWNLECTDTFCINSTWYLTYSAQDDTLWYASAPSPHGPYTEPKRLEGKLFYAAKHVDNGKDYYMAGWARRGQSLTSTQKIDGWAGNLMVQSLYEKESGVLALAPVKALENSLSRKGKLLLDKDECYIKASAQDVTRVETFFCNESFRITGDMVFEDSGEVGLSFDYDGTPEKSKMIVISPKDNKIKLQLKADGHSVAEIDKVLAPGTTYHFTYIQDGSVGLFSMEDVTLTVRLYGTSGKNISLFAKDNTVRFSNLRQYVH